MEHCYLCGRGRPIADLIRVVVPIRAKSIGIPAASTAYRCADWVGCKVARGTFLEK